MLTFGDFVYLKCGEISDKMSSSDPCGLRLLPGMVKLKVDWTRKRQRLPKARLKTPEPKKHLKDILQISDCIQTKR